MLQENWPVAGWGCLTLLRCDTRVLASLNATNRLFVVPITQYERPAKKHELQFFHTSLTLSSSEHSALWGNFWNALVYPG